MKQTQNLYEYLYQVLVSQFLNGAFQSGQIFPSQQEICQQYNIGITTVRKTLKMLDEQGYIHTAQGQPSIVTYQATAEEYAAFLAQRRDEIADAYRGMELLMPILYREGAKLCKESEMKNFQTLLDGISEQMGLAELYRQANAFFVALLHPLKNQLIMDLELDIENYLHTPYIPIPGVENPFALDAGRLKVWMRNAIRQIERGQFEDFCAGAARLYRESAERVDQYLCALGEHTSAQLQKHGEIHWFRPKGRSGLYSRLAMTIIRRIVGGEYDGQKYLPSIPKLMEEYGVMKDTASRAVALINSLGFARTIDKKGTIIAMDGTNPAKGSIDLAEPVIRERLTLFMNALQIVALTAHNCASSVSSIPDNLASFVEGKLLTAQDSRISPVSFQLLMTSFIQLIPYHSLKNIFEQLEELILWGHYLESVDQSLYPSHRDTAAAMGVLLKALKNRNNADLPDAFGRAFSSIYKDTFIVASQLSAHPSPTGKPGGAGGTPQGAAQYE